jgi:NDP-sugar pyrophosphorylase family protein
MVWVAGKPILGHIIDGVVDSTIGDVILIVGVICEHVVKYVTEE